MASSVGRREVISWMGVGALAPLLGACSALPGQGTGSAALDLLYVADTLDARQPGLAVVPATRLGPVSHLGRAPWMTGSSASAAHADLAPLLDASQAGAAQLGGYPVLAALLEQLRSEAGAHNCLTLENGQGWNGSGLAYLTQGESGVQGSQLLGSEVRVSSDERVLWPQRCAALYKQSSAVTLAAGLAPDQAKTLGLESLRLFERGGARIAVVGVTDPYAQDQKASLKQWYQSLQPVFQQARREADLVVALADVGTGPGLWLAERLPEIDVLLCARGQDLWPAPVQVAQASGRRVPVLFAGCRGSGAFRLRCQQVAGQWQFDARFFAAFEHQLTPAAQGRVGPLRSVLRQQRAGHAAWLDQPLARAPQALWRRDTRGGSWDRLLHQALANDSSMPVLLPGLRYDYPLAAGEAITREHLISLTGGYPAPVVEAPARQVEQVLENAAEQLFGDPLLLDNSQDLPRWQSQAWRVSYSPQGKRIAGLDAVQGLCRTFGLQFDPQAGEPLWQTLEAWLARQPSDWQLAPLQLPEVRYVQGHPGWHPRQLAS
ncbi:MULTISPECIES: lipoprotein UxpA [Pseudomonas]|uniref:2',3'-cyclic-nucleotide 2'-phosphodiesterase (5'-nucleotidase family) n=1 Tax=Pseudomonas hunanensis TaxID=1247546 RepID=A0ACC6K604_9PSED|nr:MULTISPECIES: lipoprotein UxpA [Pseudomonas]MBP2260763.1 2',3'-cyclic-nucleotide 2'-phosphodiesterase (5'-nucleotidase family) [Pseudomonas sp. BP8]MDR6713840.1 2',3'-cyclic-nucleotide 2'-phosphodiesterase (5'-nucleotidase family) [Pseudomonas hunanensis]HDS1735500.1 lipoprotein UxpA [Pseudomonas putida]